MNDVVISAEGVSKLFLIGIEQRAIGGGYSARRQFWRLLPTLFGRQIREGRDNFWALRDVNFRVNAGDVVGVVGHNGSGKSTLLKILSRVTLPSRGRFEIRGRVASLLEVGTGFHPDLTGRQNIYLNGSILGMSQREITRKFDEIVDFAEVEKFIDTPVRHYSSGMYVRLAFSVAAHLDTDILLVDEVLSVGDIKFQKKSLSRMQSTMESGKSVIFVSHNTSSIRQICNRCLWLHEGRLIADGPSEIVVEKYASMGVSVQGERTWSIDKAPAFEDKSVRLRAIRLTDDGGIIRSSFDVKESFTVEAEFDVVERKHAINVHLYFSHEVLGRVFVSMDNLDSPLQGRPPDPGHYVARCKIPAGLLNEGTFSIEYLICTCPSSMVYVTYADAITFRITDDMSAEGVRGNWVREWPAATVRPRLHWRFDEPTVIE